MSSLFPPLRGVHLAGWAICMLLALGLILITAGGGFEETLTTGYAGFMLGYCLIWVFLRFRYESIEFRTAVDVVEGER